MLIDNGRSAMLGTEFQDMLRCIRCAACMNHCPVYGAVGGHAYGWVYPGPMGSVLTPSLIGVDQAGHLPNASTFCGKCESVCPVKIPLPDLMRHWREREFERHLTPPVTRAGLRAWAWFARRPWAYRWLTRAGAWGLGRLGRKRGRFASLPFAGGWTGGRDLPAPEGDTFIARYAREQPGRAGLMSKQAVLGAIRRGLRRGPLPDDEALGLRARLAAHPRHLIPARSQLPRPAQVALFIRNVEKEFGTRHPRGRCRRRAGRHRRLPGGAEPAVGVRDGAASGVAGDPLDRPYAAACPRRPRRGHRPGQRAARLRGGRRNRHADAAGHAGASDHAEPARRHRHRRAARQPHRRRARRKPGICCAPNSRCRDRRVHAAQRHAGDGPSRSADIESTLELGAHGPRRLHIVLIDDDPAARRLMRRAARPPRPQNA